MKKLISLMLALIFVFSMATVAMADSTVPSDPDDTSNWTSVARTEAITLYKVYEVTGAHGESMIIPQENLSFTVTPITTGAPSIDAGTVSWNSDYTAISGQTGKYKATLKLGIPAYTSVGVYQYKIAESPAIGNAQGVTYSTAEMQFSVLVTYDYTNKCLKSEVIPTTVSNDPNNSDTVSGSGSNNGKYKLDTFTNKYDLGHMSVTKQVSGNLGDQNVEFEMTVTLTSVKKVLSTITVADGNNSTGTTTSIEPTNWTVATDGTFTATANIKVSHDETVFLYNIPNGVTYSVAEAAKHGVGSDGFDPNSAADTGYTVTYTNQSGTIATSQTKEVTVNNEKKIEVDTGITLDSLPFILILAVCAGAVVLFVIKRRRSVDF